MSVCVYVCVCVCVCTYMEVHLHANKALSIQLIHTLDRIKVPINNTPQ